MLTALPFAPVSPGRVAECLHVLAASNHRQWGLYHQVIMPALTHDYEMEDNSLGNVLAAEQAQNLLRSYVRITMELTLLTLGGYNFAVADTSPLLERKRQQFERWAAYASQNFAGGRERWQQQMATPFLYLPAEQQVSDYRQAIRDLNMVATVTGLYLPRLPEESAALAPLSSQRARLRRNVHRLGLHGPFLISEEPWSARCQGCHMVRREAR